MHCIKYTLQKKVIHSNKNIAIQSFFPLHENITISDKIVQTYFTVYKI